MKRIAMKHERRKAEKYRNWIEITEENVSDRVFWRKVAEDLDFAPYQRRIRTVARRRDRRAAKRQAA